MLFQRPHQRGFGITRRRLGEMLAVHQTAQVKPLAARKRPEGLSFILVIVSAIPINRQETRKFQFAAGCPQQVGPAGLGRAGFDFDANRIIDRAGHLAGDKTPPNQLIQPKLRGVETRFHYGGRAHDAGWPNGFMGLLRAFGLGLVSGRLFRGVLFAKVFMNIILRFGLRLS